MTDSNRPEYSNLDIEDSDQQSTLDFNSDDAKTPKIKATSLLLDESLSGDEIKLPKFIIDKKYASEENFDDQNFANRSVKMIHEACKVLKENNDAAPGPYSNSKANIPSSMQVDTPAPIKASSRPAILGVLSLGLVSLFAYQYNTDVLSTLIPTKESVSYPIRVASLENVNKFSTSHPQESGASNFNGWGKSSELAQADIAPKTKIAKNNHQSQILSPEQIASLKARLDGTKVVQPPKSEPANTRETANQKRNQINQLVSSQTNTPTDQVIPVHTNRSATANKNEVVGTETDSTIKLVQAENGAQNKLRQLTDSVVDQLSKLKKFEENPEHEEVPDSANLRSAIDLLVQQATSENLDSAAIENLIQEALENSNAVPLALARADGKLDTNLLLKSVLATVDPDKVKSRDDNYLAALSEEDAVTVMAKQAKAAENQNQQIDPRIKIDKNGKRSWIVVQGDSLSKIAHAVYGDPLRYTSIFKKNKRKIRNSNVLTLGTIIQLP